MHGKRNRQKNYAESCHGRGQRHAVRYGGLVFAGRRQEALAGVWDETGTGTTDPNLGVLLVLPREALESEHGDEESPDRSAPELGRNRVVQAQFCVHWVAQVADGSEYDCSRSPRRETGSQSNVVVVVVVDETSCLVFLVVTLRTVFGTCCRKLEGLAGIDGGMPRATNAVHALRVSPPWTHTYVLWYFGMCSSWSWRCWNASPAASCKVPSSLAFVQNQHTNEKSQTASWLQRNRAARLRAIPRRTLHTAKRGSAGCIFCKLHAVMQQRDRRLLASWPGGLSRRSPGRFQPRSSCFK